jgi:hypothetical protein
MSAPALPPEAAWMVRSADHHRALIDACRLALLALNTAPRFRVGDTDSYAIASRIEGAIRNAGEKPYP